MRVFRRFLSSIVEEPKLLLISRCGQCQAEIRKSFSKASYEKGVVLVRCDGCGVRHLIADHLGWFSHVKGHQLEDYYPGKVKRGNLADHLVLSAAPTTDDASKKD